MNNPQASAIPVVPIAGHCSDVYFNDNREVCLVVDGQE